jgi:two-component system chemotaxis response regulator CheB
MSMVITDHSLSQPMTESPGPIKVLIVDDSAFMRFTIAQQLNEYPELRVTGTASNGKEALKLIPQLQPDVVTLDVEMPQMDGLATLRQIMANFPRPVIMFSSLTREGAAETMQALMLGAVDFVSKPENRTDIRKSMKDLTAKIICAANAKVKPVATHLLVRPVPEQSNRPSKQVSNYQKTSPVILIGSSTGGPGALNEIVPALAHNFPSPVLIVQHLPDGFTRSFSERLNSISPLNVKEAETGDQLLVGQVLVARVDFI